MCWGGGAGEPPPPALLGVVGAGRLGPGDQVLSGAHLQKVYLNVACLVTRGTGCLLSSPPSVWSHGQSRRSEGGGGLCQIV